MALIRYRLVLGVQVNSNRPDEMLCTRTEYVSGLRVHGRLGYVTTDAEWLKESLRDAVVHFVDTQVLPPPPPELPLEI